MEEQTQTVEPPVTVTQTSVADTSISAASAPVAKPIQTQQADSQPSPFYVFSGLFVAAALVLSGYGLYTLYNDDYKAQVVGGDAYNFIIYATRGTAWICAGIVCAVLSVAFALFAQATQKEKGKVIS